MVRPSPCIESLPDKGGQTACPSPLCAANGGASVCGLKSFRLKGRMMNNDL
ncbi:hypothetical protein L195_g047013 [Trifolium pratense]|uniref:Uncharacterized protein n=1 Tax=Trifolium pratense TaxID=57577 RepID=A0A2K3MJA6_TRIPR|nr:hypothetical protein L195_g047013 [Trifolium pratense]